ncbi:MAG: hypothetical protein C0467_17150 [Planctomycetaceae bacterium]|nr:hypothetical protein [Planctomycetaceae bacterium]
MMIASTAQHRRGFTLIELLVVMALIAALAAIAMIVAPGAMNKDRAASAVSQIQGALQISRARAIRDNTPRGIRLIWNGTNNVTEYQYIEMTPVIVPNPGGPLGMAPYPANGAPYVEFSYTAGPAVSNRTCTITAPAPGLTAGDQLQIVAGGTLYLPTLGTWHRILTASGTTTKTITLDSYPDQQLGAATRWRTYHFGLNGGPRILLGEPTIQLPASTCVDLGLSSPPGGGGSDYDILFAPSGLVVNTGSTQGAGQIFLWVRDPNKPANFNQGGEQLVVSIKAKSGGIGAAPVDWGSDPFILAKKSLSGQ